MIENPPPPFPSIPAGSSGKAKEEEEADKYYADLMSRVDQHISLRQSHLPITFRADGEGGEAGLRGGGGSRELEPPPATFLAYVLHAHSVLSTFWHLPLENTFTRPLKIYFMSSSLLWVLFLGVKIRLATTFADFLIVSFVLNLAHWFQRFLFFKFQTSLLLWPFCSVAVLLVLFIYDLYLIITEGAETLHHAVSVAVLSYLFGFLLPEAVVLAFRWRRRRRLQLEEGGGLGGVGGGEEYSTL